MIRSGDAQCRIYDQRSSTAPKEQYSLTCFYSYYF